LYYGDNLQVLREHIKDESVDLIYIDPPFNSAANYNVIFREHSGDAPSQAQIQAFKDTWTWTPDADGMLNDLVERNGQVAEFLDLIIRTLNKDDLSAYLVMMAVRLVELHRVLKPTGSFYLHCDGTASHYLKATCDVIFGAANFRNEIIWKRRYGFSSAVHESNRFGICTDSILYYAKSAKSAFHPQYNKDSKEYQEYIEKYFKLVDADGRRYQATSLTNPAYRPNLIYEYKGYKPPRNGWMISKEKMEQWDKEGRIHFPKKKDGRLRRKSYVDELRGMPIQNLWDDISPIGAHSVERLGYPTQKPVALLERIINASSNEGDVVLDAFCGCGTAIVAAQGLRRKWIGIDITHLAVALMEGRLKRDFDLDPGKDYFVEGTPTTVSAAQFLFDQDAYQFQFWAVGLIGAQPFGAGSTNKKGKKGGDGGIDGLLFFRTPGGERVDKAIVSVKGGKNLAPNMIRDLDSVVSQQKAAIGVFITLHEPTSGMLESAAKMGVYEYGGVRVPKIQIRTIEQLLSGYRPDIPQGSLNVSLEAKEQQTLEKESKRRNQASLFESNSK
jgi:site-specific DNA-methyltransferase (adenine-specific)